MVSPPWAGVNPGFTLLFEALILELCRNMPVSTVGKIISESYDKLWRILGKYIDETRAQCDYSIVSNVGIDETSRAKGHDYISLFVDLEEKRTLFITEGKGSETMKAFARDLELHQGNPEKVVGICCDMSPAFIRGISDSFPAAEITFDKFHILKLI